MEEKSAGLLYPFGFCELFYQVWVDDIMTMMLLNSILVDILVDILDCLISRALSSRFALFFSWCPCFVRGGGYMVSLSFDGVWSGIGIGLVPGAVL